MERNTNPDWAASLHKHLGEDWPLAVILLTHVLGSRFAWKFAEREAILAASEGLGALIADEALLQRGFSIEDVQSHVSPYA